MYARNIAPYIETELCAAFQARSNGDPTIEFHHLERAHVLGQESTRWHTKVHLLMLLWAIRNRVPREFFGQLLRVIGALTKTAIGLVPAGNTGGANVSPFKSMPIPSELQAIIQSARSNV